MSQERIAFNRAAFLAGSIAAVSALPEVARGSGAPGSSGPAPSPEHLLGRLMAGNNRFVHNDFPTLTNRIAEKREMLKKGQAPFAAMLSCADSRVVPNLVFVQGLGDLFVTRVAGNYPDDLVSGSIEYAVEHLGTRLVMVLGHESCGAVAAVYSAIETKTTLPPHLSTIQRFLAPGISDVVRAHGSQMAAVEANVRAAVTALKTMPPELSQDVNSGRVLVVGGVYELGSGQV
ncbi:MAG: carbonic anhydrase, partial [Candidatus Cybelea sp.]